MYTFFTKQPTIRQNKFIEKTCGKVSPTLVSPKFAQFRGIYYSIFRIGLFNSCY